MSSGSGEAERFVLQRSQRGSFELPRSQRLMQRVFFESIQTELAKRFDAATIARGRVLFEQGGVIGCDKFRGRGNYHVHMRDEDGSHSYSLLELRPRVSGVSIDGTCSCSAGRRCVHLVAGAMVALAPSLRAELVAAMPVEALRPELRDWLRSVDPAQRERQREVRDKRIVYFCNARKADLHKLITVATVPVFADGGFGTPHVYHPFHLSNNSASYVTIADQGIGFELSRLAHVTDYSHARRAQAFADLMRRIIATGRAYFESIDGPLLHAAAARRGSLAWRRDAWGAYEMRIELADDAAIMTTLSPWYILPDGSCGPIELDCTVDELFAAVTLPKLEPNELPLAQEAIALRGPSTNLPPIAGISIVCDEVAPVMHLSVTRTVLHANRIGLSADLTFAYDGHRVSQHASIREFRAVRDGTLHIVRRDLGAESAAAELLATFGFRAAGDPVFGAPLLALPGLTLAHEHVAAFLHHALPQLADRGWRVVISGDVDMTVLDARAPWTMQAEPQTPNWFSLDLGIDIAGTHMSLLPILLDLLKRLPTHADLDAGLRTIACGDTIYLLLPTGRAMLLPLARVKCILETLKDAHARRDGDTVRVSLPDLLDLSGDGDIRVSDTRLRGFLQALDRRGSVEPPSLPAEFAATLRPYQAEGVAWLQLLQGHGLGGILADEMGLGKTVQTIAHLSIEHAAGRLKAPALIVVPTSVLPNWRREFAQFAPGLRIANMHGPDRDKSIANFGSHDVILTTYALLQRDAHLVEQTWSTVVLDEAQFIKNARSKTARAARALQASSRICLSGTPVQNDLLELWSLFAFAMPGLLGEEQAFTQRYRQPIEHFHDEERRAALSRRIAPFFLRRRKELVAADLPEKTEIVRRIALSGDQRDAYEALRVAMQKRVREHIELQGIKRSKIVVLDAILKLRQICCDPRLSALPSVRTAKTSVKLAALVDLVSGLRAEGRRILIFSQFTGMLRLIEAALQAIGMENVILTGETLDRETPVERFQSGDVPIFLISLRAGGTGLNLTAADTVIHYDQWWNPSVEAQATDRAHRIGQEKPVFIYKLVVADSVEERVLEIQERKGRLSDTIMQGGEDALTAFDEKDIEQFFTA